MLYGRQKEKRCDDGYYIKEMLSISLYYTAVLTYLSKLYTYIHILIMFTLVLPNDLLLILFH